MARQTEGTNTFLYTDAPAILTTAPPMTYVTWYKQATPAPQTRALMCITNYNALGWYLLNITAVNQLQAYAYDGVSVGNAIAPPTLVNNQWHHCAGVFRTTGNRSAYLDGVRGDNTVTVTPAGILRFYVGVLVFTQSSQAAIFTPGAYADTAIYRAALTDDEINALRQGVSPLLVRPDSLVAYWPLLGTGAASEQDRWRDKLDLIVANAVTTVDPPRIFNPWHTSVPDASLATTPLQAATSVSFAATAALSLSSPLAATSSLGFATTAGPLAPLPVNAVALRGHNTKSSDVLDVRPVNPC